MDPTKQFLAFDFGAESGRGMLVTLSGDTVTLDELRRWDNRPVEMAGTLYWDFPFLVAEVLETLRLCDHRSIHIDAIGVDTWGVDFGLLDSRGKLLGLPVHYRDKRTENIYEFADPSMTADQLFAATGYSPWPIASVYQLASMQRDRDPLLPAARTFLNMPDLFNYILTGVARAEFSIANNSGILGTDGQWSDDVIQAFGFPDMFPPVVQPGTLLGPLQPSIQQKTGLGPIPVIATCGHDTAAVVASVPAEGENWAFLSCGTWSILGSLVDDPVTSPEALAAGFANEGTLGGWYMCKNILGLWLLQELKRKWDVENDPWSYDRILTEATRATYDGVVDVSSDALSAPADMEQALQAALASTDQPPCQTRGQLARCVVQSLALEYAKSLRMLDELTGTTHDRLYIVGGGIRNTLLCQLTADATGLAVHAGVDQCTALGNALTCAVGIGALDSTDDIRTIVRNSHEMKTYLPAVKVS